MASHNFLKIVIGDWALITYNRGTWYMFLLDRFDKPTTTRLDIVDGKSPLTIGLNFNPILNET